VYPKRLPDLFRGTQTMVFGRYEGRGAVRPQLIGMALGKEEKIAGQGDFGDDGKFNDMLPRLWAMRKVGYLVDEARRSGRAVDTEVKDEIIKLSKKYGIVTPFTAGLITEDTRPRSVTASPDMDFSRRDAALGARGPAGAAGIPGPAGPAGAPPPGPSHNWALDSSIPAISAPTSGAGGVAAAKANKEMREAEKLKDEDTNVRYIDGKSFFLRNGVWTDGAYDEAKSPKVTAVKFASAEYFALLKDKQIAKWLSVGERVLIVLKDKTVQIEP
jgi:Ca-activated chloride channel family protein